MTVREKDSFPVELAVTTDLTTPKEKVLSIEGVTTSEKVVFAVSCTLHAQLRGSTADFTIEPSGYQDRALTDPSSAAASWTWTVEALRPGDHTLFYDLKPVADVTLMPTSATSSGLGATPAPSGGLAEKATVVTVHSDIHVEALPPTITEWWTTTTGILTTVFGLIVAGAAAWKAVPAFSRLLKRRKANDADAGDNAVPKSVLSATATPRRSPAATAATATDDVTPPRPPEG